MRVEAKIGVRDAYTVYASLAKRTAAHSGLSRAAQTHTHRDFLSLLP